MPAIALPEPCGPLSERVVQALSPNAGGGVLHAVPDATEAGSTSWSITDRDFQLALWILYELHYQGFEGVDPAAEWDPMLLVSRAGLERAFEDAIRELVAERTTAADLTDLGGNPAERIQVALERMTSSEGPSEIALFLQREAESDDFAAYLSQRAVHHLRESDPHSFVLPRVGGAAKVALAELQYDEYGAGRPERLHQELYAQALSAIGLPTDLGHHVAGAHATTLAAVNVMSLFALNRRLRGAALGHLAAFEATSSLPCDRILRGTQRLGLPPEVGRYYDEHVEADAVHEQVAIRDICGALVADEPDLMDDVVFGATACLALDGLAGTSLLESLRSRASEPRPATKAAG